MAKYELQYLDIKVKRFNKISTLRKFATSKCYKTLRVVAKNDGNDTIVNPEDYLGF